MKNSKNKKHTQKQQTQVSIVNKGGAINNGTQIAIQTTNIETNQTTEVNTNTEEEE